MVDKKLDAYTCTVRQQADYRNADCTIVRVIERQEVN